MPNLGTIGSQISLRLGDDKKVEGWLYGEIPQGILISLDQQGNDIRLITGRSQGASYRYENTATFLPQNIKEIDQKINDINESVSEPMNRSLEKINYAPLQAFAKRASQLELDIQRWIH